MDIKQFAKDHIKDLYVMQLATSCDNQPWACTVTFFADDDLNLYWMSAPDCRHSEDIAANPRTAAAFAVHTEMPLIGVQIEGDTEQLEFVGNEATLDAYALRHNRQKAVEGALNGKMDLKLYRLTPRAVQIFDLKNFPQAPKQEWRAN